MVQASSACAHRLWRPVVADSTAMTQPSSPHGVGATEPAAGTAVSGALGTVAAFLPHVLHHVGLIAGAAFVSGFAGGVVFAALGVAAMAPIVLRLRRRTGSWHAPIVAAAVFGAMFALMTGITHSM